MVLISRSGEKFDESLFLSMVLCALFVAILVHTFLYFYTVADSSACESGEFYIQVETYIKYIYKM